MRPASLGVGVVSEDFIIRREIWCLCPSITSSVSLSSSLSLFVCFIFFLPLTATQRGAISHSAQRGLEELKATEQKKNRKTETGKETGELRKGRGWSEVLRREQTRQGTVAHREMEGLGIKEEDGGK